MRHARESNKYFKTPYLPQLFKLKPTIRRSKHLLNQLNFKFKIFTQGRMAPKSSRDNLKGPINFWRVSSPFNRKCILSLGSICH